MVIYPSIRPRTGLIRLWSRPTDLKACLVAFIKMGNSEERDLDGAWEWCVEHCIVISSDDTVHILNFDRCCGIHGGHSLIRCKDQIQGRLVRNDEI